MTDEKKERILKEQLFPYENITIDERDFCIKLLNHCKDVCDSENKIDSVGKGKLVNAHFSKEGNSINANGAFSIKNENRAMDANIYIKENKIFVFMDVIRLSYDGENKSYNVVDEFEIKDGKLVRKSYYNYDKNNFIQYIEDEELKSKIK